MGATHSGSSTRAKSTTRTASPSPQPPPQHDSSTERLYKKQRKKVEQVSQQKTPSLPPRTTLSSQHKAMTRDTSASPPPPPAPLSSLSIAAQSMQSWRSSQHMTPSDRSTGPFPASGDHHHPSSAAANQNPGPHRGQPSTVSAVSSSTGQAVPLQQNGAPRTVTLSLETRSSCSRSNSNNSSCSKASGAAATSVMVAEAVQQRSPFSAQTMHFEPTSAPSSPPPHFPDDSGNHHAMTRPYSRSEDDAAAATSGSMAGWLRRRRASLSRRWRPGSAKATSRQVEAAGMESTAAISRTATGESAIHDDVGEGLTARHALQPLHVAVRRLSPDKDRTVEEVMAPPVESRSEKAARSSPGGSNPVATATHGKESVAEAAVGAGAPRPDLISMADSTPDAADFSRPLVAPRLSPRSSASSSSARAAVEEKDRTGPRTFLQPRLRDDQDSTTAPPPTDSLRRGVGQPAVVAAWSRRSARGGAELAGGTAAAKSPSRAKVRCPTTTALDEAAISPSGGGALSWRGPSQGMSPADFRPVISRRRRPPPLYAMEISPPRPLLAPPSTTPSTEAGSTAACSVVPLQRTSRGSTSRADAPPAAAAPDVTQLPVAQLAHRLEGGGSSSQWGSAFCSPPRTGQGQRTDGVVLEKVDYVSGGGGGTNFSDARLAESDRQLRSSPLSSTINSTVDWCLPHYPHFHPRHLTYGATLRTSSFLMHPSKRQSGNGEPRVVHRRRSRRVPVKDSAAITFRQWQQLHQPPPPQRRYLPLWEERSTPTMLTSPRSSIVRDAAALHGQTGELYRHLSNSFPSQAEEAVHGGGGRGGLADDAMAEEEEYGSWGSNGSPIWEATLHRHEDEDGGDVDDGDGDDDEDDDEDEEEEDHDATHRLPPARYEPPMPSNHNTFTAFVPLSAIPSSRVLATATGSLQGSSAMDGGHAKALLLDLFTASVGVDSPRATSLVGSSLSTAPTNHVSRSSTPPHLTTATRPRSTPSQWRGCSRIPSSNSRDRGCMGSNAAAGLLTTASPALPPTSPVLDPAACGAVRSPRAGHLHASFLSDEGEEEMSGGTASPPFLLATRQMWSSRSAPAAPLRSSIAYSDRRKAESTDRADDCYYYQQTPPQQPWWNRTPCTDGRDFFRPAIQKGEEATSSATSPSGGDATKAHVEDLPQEATTLHADTYVLSGAILLAGEENQYGAEEAAMQEPVGLHLPASPSRPSPPQQPQLLPSSVNGLCSSGEELGNVDDDGDLQVVAPTVSFLGQDDDRCATDSEMESFTISVPPVRRRGRVLPQPSALPTTSSALAELPLGLALDAVRDAEQVGRRCLEQSAEAVLELMQRWASDWRRMDTNLQALARRQLVLTSDSSPTTEAHTVGCMEVLVGGPTGSNRCTPGSTASALLPDAPAPAATRPPDSIASSFLFNLSASTSHVASGLVSVSQPSFAARADDDRGAVVTPSPLPLQPSVLSATDAAVPSSSTAAAVVTMTPGTHDDVLDSVSTPPRRHCRLLSPSLLSDSSTSPPASAVTVAEGETKGGEHCRAGAETAAAAAEGGGRLGVGPPPPPQQLSPATVSLDARSMGQQGLASSMPTAINTAALVAALPLLAEASPDPRRPSVELVSPVPGDDDDSGDWRGRRSGGRWPWKTSAAILSPSPTSATAILKVKSVTAGVERQNHRKNQATCHWCGQLYSSAAVCSVSSRRHGELRQERRRQKKAKQSAQVLLRGGQVSEAVALLESAGLYIQ